MEFLTEIHVYEGGGGGNESFVVLNIWSDTFRVFFFSFATDRAHALRYNSYASVRCPVHALASVFN